MSCWPVSAKKLLKPAFETTTSSPLAISLAEVRGAKRLGYAGCLMRDREQRGLLDRELEELPSDGALEVLQAKGQGLIRPELAVLLSWSKIALAQVLLAKHARDESVNQ